MKTALPAFLSAALLALPAAARPTVTHIDPPRNILFVGNSFNY